MFSEEEVARLSGEVAWLKEETRHGDRRVVELEEQVLIASDIADISEHPFIVTLNTEQNLIHGFLQIERNL